MGESNVGPGSVTAEVESFPTGTAPELRPRGADEEARPRREVQIADLCLDHFPDWRQRYPEAIDQPAQQAELLLAFYAALSLRFYGRGVSDFVGRIASQSPEARGFLCYQKLGAEEFQKYANAHGISLVDWTYKYGLWRPN